MRYNIFLFALIALLSACGNGAKQNNDATADATEELSAQAITVDSVLSVAPNIVGKEVVVKGNVTHVCHRTHHRCFIRGERKTNIRIEAGEQLGGFNNELIGSQLIVKGTIGESHLSLEYVKSQKERIEKHEAEDGSSAQCDAERVKVEEMEKWMAEHGTDYYPVYFITASDFESVVD